MKNKVIMFLLFSIFIFSSATTLSFTGSNDIIGSWKFTRYIYQDNELPAPNPQLTQILSFDETGTSRLYYSRADEEGFCERLAVYSYIPTTKTLLQQVVWVNPKNQRGCSMDPDMILGRKTSNPAWVVGQSFYLVMPLSDETITFIWDKLPN